MPAVAKEAWSTVPRSALRSILRRWEKPRRTSSSHSARSTSSGSRGVVWRTSSTSAESTRGRGMNTVAGTLPTILAVAQDATFTDRAP